ncbi:MAG TPA: NADH-quinone oxidoreductase subunit N [Thermoplasmata archaeon]|nr:NADH-quinone oxidoreductase subunit N [Thermoplasmata archaeon]
MNPVEPFTPELLLLGGTLVIFLLDVLGFRQRALTGGVAVAAILLALGSVLADLGVPVLGSFSTLPGGAPYAPGLLYGFGLLGLDFQGIFLASALLVSLASLSGTTQGRGVAVFYGLLLLATLGMLLAAMAADLIFLLLALEIVAVSSYLLVGYTRRESRSLEAAMKFYIIGAFSAALSFFGASLLFGAFGTTSLLVVGHSGALLPGSGSPSLALAGYGFLLVGLGFKVTAVPFHMWAVDVYDGAPDEVSAFLAGGTKKVGIFAYVLVFLPPLLYFSSRLFSGPSVWTTVSLGLAILAVLTMTVANLLALMQQEMKRLLAYSSISQAGYMLIGVAIGTGPALAGAGLQVFAHVFLKAGAFLVVAAVTAIGVGPRVADWRGLGGQRPWLSASFAVMLLGLAGIPLTVGFVSKFILFSAAVEAQGWYIWLAVAGLLNSALSVFYYARVLKVMYLDSAEPEPATVPGAVSGAAAPSARLAFQGVGIGRAVAIGLCVVVIFAIGVYPQPVFAALQAGAQQLVQWGV